MLIPSIDCKLHTKDVPDLNEYLFVWIHAVQTLMRVLKMYIAGEMWQNLIFVVVERMMQHDNRTMKESYAIIKPIKLYTPLLCTTKFDYHS